MTCMMFRPSSAVVRLNHETLSTEGNGSGRVSLFSLTRLIENFELFFRDYEKLVKERTNPQ